MNISPYRPFVGEAIPNALPTPDRQESYRINWRQLHINYGDNVEFERLRNQIWLCPETRDMIYAPPAAIRYRRGERPELENAVDAIIAGLSDDRTRALALMDYVRDLYRVHDDQQLFFGGTEEELIKKGERLCECLARLIVSMAEIAGIPGRIVLHISGGHVVSELFVEDHWAYIDPRCGMYYEKETGQLASVEEIVAQPALMYSQRPEVRAHVSPIWTYEMRMKRNATQLFHPDETQCFCDYSLMDRPLYHYGWKSVRKAVEDGLMESKDRYAEYTERIFHAGRPDFPL